MTHTKFSKLIHSIHKAIVIWGAYLIGYPF
jgi:hypothetical protein